MMLMLVHSARDGSWAVASEHQGELNNAFRLTACKSPTNKTVDEDIWGFHEIAGVSANNY